MQNDNERALRNHVKALLNVTLRSLYQSNIDRNMIIIIAAPSDEEV